MQLKCKARSIALHGMALAAETQRLCDLAETAGIPAVVLKGTPLALLAYDTVHTKHAKDIDLAVSSDDRTAMGMVLTEAGYLGTGTPNGKDEPWYHTRKRIQVELHVALVDHPSWLPGLVPGPDLPRQWVGEGRGVPTLVSGDLFAYLCVHGSTHGWSRLKWLADVAALLSCRTPDEIVGLYKHASAQGAERHVAAALLLCSDLLGIRLRFDHEAALRRRVLIRWLVGNARRSYVGRNETIEMDTMPLSTLRIHLAQIVATIGLRDRGLLITAKLDGKREYGGSGRWPIAIGRWIARRFHARQHCRARPKA